MKFVNRFLAGEWVATQQVVGKSGAIYPVSVEKYDEGFVFFIVKEDGKYTNYALYATIRKAINAAAKQF